MCERTSVRPSNNRSPENNADQSDRPDEATEEASQIAYCKIFPPLGIARLGNSPDGFFIGPEVAGLVPDPATTATRIPRAALSVRPPASTSTPTTPPTRSSPS